MPASRDPQQIALADDPQQLVTFADDWDGADPVCKQNAGNVLNRASGFTVTASCIRLFRFQPQGNRCSRSLAASSARIARIARRWSASVLVSRSFR